MATPKKKPVPPAGRFEQAGPIEWAILAPLEATALASLGCRLRPHFDRR